MGSGSDKVKRLLETAQRQIQQGERKEALRTYQKALDLDPENEQILERINSVEREIAAMDKFNKSRSNRVHSAGRTISSTGFVEECIARSDEAFEAGDEVRALQELERANRHDPGNKNVQKKIKFVRRAMKVSSLADLVRTRLKSGDIAFAVENLRRIFDLWPGAPVLDELMAMVEQQGEPGAARTEAAAVAVEAPAKKAGPPAAEKKKPRGEEVAAPKPAPPEDEKKRPAAVPIRSDRGKNRTMIYVIGVVALAVIVFGVIKLTSKGEPEPDIPEVIPAEPFTQTMIVQGPDNAVVSVDGTVLQPQSPGVYVLSDTVFTPRNIRISADGYETVTLNPRFEEGQVVTDTLTLDTLGTTVVQVSFGYQMPEGAEDPGPDAVSFLVDGEPIEGNVDSIYTGDHVFQASLEGYRAIPESVLVAVPMDFQQTLNLLAAEQSQITIQLGAETPGNASFYVDGNRVATGRRMSEVLPFGTYYIQVQMEGRTDWTASVNLGEDGYSRTINLEEEIQMGQLMVGPEPWSDVYVDGSLVGTTPFGGVELEPGNYTVRLSNPDFEDDVHSVEIVAGETTSIQYNAVPVATEEPVEDTTEVAEIPTEDLPITSPFPISQTLPEIPSQARARGDLHDYVTLAVVVGADGSVQDVTIVNDPLGLGCGQAAVNAVRNWVFSPAMQGDQPVEVTTNVQVRFDID